MGYGTPFPLLGDYSLRLRELCERLNSDSVLGQARVGTSNHVHVLEVCGWFVPRL